MTRCSIAAGQQFGGGEVPVGAPSGADRLQRAEDQVLERSDAHAGRIECGLFGLGLTTIAI
jgi:hypothetical protein